MKNSNASDSTVAERFKERISKSASIYIRPTSKDTRAEFIKNLENVYGYSCDVELTKQEIIDSNYPIEVIYNQVPRIYTCKWNTTSAASAVQSGVVFSEDDFYAFFELQQGFCKD